MSDRFIAVDFDPFAPAAPATVPTTEEQREIWTSILIGGEASSLSYNESITLYLDGNCNIQQLTEACKAVVQRHEILRSTFAADGNSYSVASEVKLEIPVIDLTDLNPSEKKNRISHFAQREAEIPFDLATGPVIRFAIFKISSSETALTFTAHHMVCDGWSIGIILQDISKFYSAFIKNETPVLDDVFAFSEYSARQQQRKLDGSYERCENYWLKMYEGEIPVLDLPVNKTRPSSRTFNAKRLDLEVDAELVSAVKKFGAKNNSSFVNTLFAAFEIFLYRLTSQRDLVVGLPAAGQSASEMYALVGHCVNLLPVRTLIDEKMTFAEYLKSRKPAMLDVFDHQEFTMGSLLSKLPLQRDPSRIPLVPAVFNVDLGITQGVNFEGLTYRFVSNPRKFENFEFFLNATGMGDTLILESSFNTDLFDDEMIRLRMEEFVMLLKDIIASPQLPVSELNLLTRDEQQKIFVDWMGKDETFTAYNAIHQMIEAVAEQHPEKTALVYENRKLSYGELNEQSDALAVHLQQSGVGKDALVAVYMERSPEIIIAILAVLKAGGAYVPIDFSYPQDRISYLLQDAGCPLIITQEKYKKNLPETGATILLREEWNEIFSKHKGQKPESKTQPSDLCYVIYTSGSTGKPKGVLIEHQTVINYISYCNKHYFGDPPYGNFGLYSSLSFDLTVTSIFCTLTRGKTLTIFNQIDDVLNILKQTFQQDSAIDAIKMTPAHILALETLSLKSHNIKKAIVGGEEMLPRHVEILRAINSEMEIINEYGPTEATVGCIVKNVIRPDDALTIGKAISNTQVYIFDKNLQPVPPGVQGRLFIGGNGLARGYKNRPELTNEKFVSEKYSGAALRVYDTGDIARFRLNGDMEFLGRTDNQVKIRGYRIEIGEIENVIAAQKNVKEVTVIVREDKPNDKRLVAYVVPENKAENTDLKELLKSVLPDYMVPSAMVWLDKIPLTANGKVDRKALPVPEVNTKSESANFEEPHNPLESLLAGIWSDILGLDKIGIHDNFFELGGHSLLGIKMMGEIEKKTGVKLDYPTLFRASTISQLAKVINAEDLNMEWPIVVPLQQGGSKTPLFLVHMHNGNIQRWRVLLKYLDKEQPVYAIQPRGLDEKYDYHYAINDMAKFYIDEIKKVQPHGPYRLGGLCFGGTVALEIARQLSDMGEKSELVFMINNYAPPSNPMQYKIRETWDEFKGMNMEAKLEFALEKTKNAGKKVLSKLTSVFDSGKNSQTEDNVKTKPDIRWVHSVALLHYQPATTYKGDVVLVKTGDEVAKHYDETLGWKRLISGNIEMHIVPESDNDSIITTETYYSVLGALLNQKLNGR